VQMNTVDGMETMVSLVQDNKELEIYHRDRYQHCFYLMVKELSDLKDKNVIQILDKYSCGLMDYPNDPGYKAVSLRFPISFKDSDLPEKLQEKSNPDREKQLLFKGKAHI
jgi:hypothetical protein